MTSALDSLSPRQRALLDQWLPGATVERDHGWGLVATTVLEVTQAGSRFIVKAGGESDHHIERELEAHRNWLGPWTSRGRAPVLEHADAQATYRQAGELLALLHSQTAATDDDYESRENRKSLALLDAAHRIAPPTVERLRAEIASWPAPAAALVPTHGDWQPRNWLIHNDIVSVIDFGRAAMRPAWTDLARLTAQDFRRDPNLEAAFLDGYGTDPREPGAWHRTLVREAIGTATWAYRVGAEAFEAQGHRMIDEALSTS